MNLKLAVQIDDNHLEFTKRHLKRTIPDSYRKLVKQNPFYDKADTHIYSDWLVPYIFGIGVEDLNEYYLGGFPDLSLFLNRNEEGTEIQWEVFEELARSHLTDFGKKFAKLVQSKVFIDLGCGLRYQSVIPRLFAQRFGALYYLGVDSQHVQDECIQNEWSELGEFKSWYFRDDILSFLSKLEDLPAAIYFLAGVELISKDTPFEKSYLAAVTNELGRLTQPGDIIVLAAGSPDFRLEKENFKNFYGDDYHDFYIRRQAQPQWLRTLRGLWK